MLDRVAQAQQAIEEACRGLDRQITIMEVCGTHTVSIFRSGIRSILPDQVKLLEEFGCVVKIIPDKADASFQSEIAGAHA
jgi:hydrogenase expression/formation protein HypD